MPLGASGSLLFWTPAFRKCWNNKWKTELVMASNQFCCRKKPLAWRDILKGRLWGSLLVWNETIWMNQTHRHLHTTQCFYVRCDPWDQTHKLDSLYASWPINHILIIQIVCVLKNWIMKDWLTNSVCLFQTATCLSAITEEPVRRPCTLPTTSVSVLQASVGLTVRSVSTQKLFHLGCNYSSINRRFVLSNQQSRTSNIQFIIASNREKQQIQFSLDQLIS